MAEQSICFIGTNSGYRLAPISPLSTSSTRTICGDPEMSQIFVSDCSKPEHWFQHTASGTLNSAVGFAVNEDFGCPDIEPSIFSSPSLYSVHSQVSVHQDKKVDMLFCINCMWLIKGL